MRRRGRPGENGSKESPANRQPHPSILSNEQVREIVIKHFIDLERESEEWLRQKGQVCPIRSGKECVENIAADCDAYNGMSKVYGPYDPSSDLDRMLAKWGLALEKQSDTYAHMGDLLRRARLESTTRKLLSLETGGFKTEDPFSSRMGSIPLLKNAEGNTSNLSIGKLASVSFLSAVEKLATHRARCAHYPHTGPVTLAIFWRGL